ncbi:chitinase [Streptomyces sp. CB01201]|uniref:chitinase C-terminal domain-containing protein n=1 Tax=Streptomyces sp. CB01201 TaxID=2020324 RepID=UPI000C274E78|nr:chitinase C-terminal domain-containing protein [Streptomyces sp. CB01201]PJN00980.1 chitinase [Streptomyces sp. CB01201]
MLSPTRRRTALLTAATAVAGLLFGALSTGVSQAAVDNEACRPDGLYKTPGVDVPYCSVYDTDGREKMGADHQRRVIGYFTGWRTGQDGTPAYLASDIPWDKVTHINYAFAHVGSDNKISVGTDSDKNAATGMTWPGVAGAEMDPSLPYKGHFNLLNKFKKQHPNVKTLISVGGWAETGGYFGDDGKRVDSGGFYAMATNADGSVNQAGVDTFADSAVAFIKKYGFNGVDIDYEYPTTMKDAGNPLDLSISNARRAGLVKGYAALMKSLREKLDRAGAADGKHYLLSVAAPSSGYLLRGMETFQVQQYLDYVNIMSYDLHGAWNQYVGPNASLFDDGKDAELAAAGVYSTSQYGGIGYLNADWAYHYFRGSMPAGRINMGLPYYTRGFQNVQGGTNGLWGKAPSTTCPAGSGLTACGDGAVGIDNLWHDLDANGKEAPAGSNPMWHAKNLEKGIVGDYVTQYGLPAATKLTGSYVRNYDSTLVAPWLWNDQKKVFLSTEDEQSVGAKADYVVDKGIGGTMVWELAGDYQWNAGKGQYEQGSTLTSEMYDKFKSATPYGNKRSTIALPSQALNIGVDFGQFPLGDSNYPISPKVTLTNNTTATLPGGTEFQFDYGTSAPANAKDQSGFGTTIVRSDHTAANNIGGLKGDYNRVSLKLPSWQSLAPGASVTLDFVYYLPVSTPSNWTVTFGGKTYALAGDRTRGAVVSDPGTSTPTPTPSGTPTPTPAPTPSGTTGPSPSPTPPGGTCAAPVWSAGSAYGGGTTVSYKSHTWKSKWWTKGEEPGTTGDWGVWQDLGAC